MRQRGPGSYDHFYKKDEDENRLLKDARRIEKEWTGVQQDN